MSLGERIRIARDAKGLKQSELAEMIEVKSAGVISNWEKDINKPDADKIIKLCEVLEISASYLLDYYGNTLNISLEEQKHIKIIQIFLMNVAYNQKRNKYTRVHQLHNCFEV